MNRRKWIYIGILIVVAAIVSIASFSYAFLTRVDEQHGKINIVAGILDYKIESDNLSNNSITLSANESKEIEITIKSVNKINSKYQLYTNNVENVDIRYTDEEEPGVGTISSNGTKVVKVVLENNSDTNKTITFGVQGGFEDKTLTLEDNRVAVVLGERLCDVAPGTVYNFDYNGTNGSDGSAQEFNVRCTGTYKIEAWGAQGTGDGGYGGYTSGLIQLEKGINMYLYVGGQTTILYDYTVGGYNGGGYGTTYGEVSGYTTYSYAGGGATDIRITDGVWSNFASLKSRIMVAAGGAGKQYNNKNGLTGAIPGYGGGINGGAASGQKYSTFPQPTGATQINGGVGENSSYNGLFGMSIQSSPNNCWGSGGGSGYYGGAYGCGAAGSGGSSFISGYSGCNAIAESSTSSNIIHTNQSNHYSGLVFTNAVMIDGKGCNWSTGTATNCGANQPQPNGTNAVGHSGNGYARITYIGD